MANKQPFYNSASILFTTVGKVVSIDELTEILKKGLKRRLVKDSIIVESLEVQAGDPADLL